MNLVKSSYENGVCPDCHEKIPNNVVAGDCCTNCDHVFWQKSIPVVCENCGDETDDLHKVKYADDDGVSSMMVCKKCDEQELKEAIGLF